MNLATFLGVTVLPVAVVVLLGFRAKVAHEREYGPVPPPRRVTAITAALTLVTLLAVALLVLGPTT